MSDTRRVQSLLVEFNRFASAGSGIAAGKAYIRTVGLDAPAKPVEMPLDNEEFQRLMWRLRTAAAAQLSSTLAELSAVPEKLFEKLPPWEQALLQVDLVSNAPELWAVPFETWCDEQGVPRFANRERPAVLTRRVRGEFADRTIQWPAKPRVLFVHAAAGGDLEKDLVDAHVEALRSALAPHARGRAADEKLLTVRQVFSVADLKKARAAGEFTHVHVLAHGQAIPDPELPAKTWWGLRLGPTPGDAVRPAELAEALQPDANGLPVVVTLAACDSGNQADTNLPTASLVHELHRRGVPVVVGSQLPLTKHGSVVLAEGFYTPLLRGDDVRVALHEARAKLYDARAAGAGCDWVALVGYVRLPEGYARHLKYVALQTELAMLDAAQASADALNRESAPVPDRLKLEARLRDRIAALERRLEDLRNEEAGLPQECEGLLASAHKRYAELLFGLARVDDASAAATWRERSRAALAQALHHYREAFQSGLEAHWQGIQQLGLQAALEGTVDLDAWTAVEWAARKAARNPKEYWALGTLIEAYMLAPLADRGDRMKDARAAVGALRGRAPADDPFPIATTRRQLMRYVEWWTNGNEFFPRRADLAKAAFELVELLG